MNIDTSPYKLIIFDVDGTLRRCTIPNQPCPNKPGEWELLPNVLETMYRIVANKPMIALASNQAGIAAGYLTRAMAYRLMRDLTTALRIVVDWIAICHHAIDEGCVCRKPAPGLLYQTMDACGIHRCAEALMVGDMETDREAAQRAGIDFCWAADVFDWKTESSDTCIDL